MVCAPGFSDTFTNSNIYSDTNCYIYANAYGNFYSDTDSYFTRELVSYSDSNAMVDRSIAYTDSNPDPDSS